MQNGEEKKSQLENIGKGSTSDYGQTPGTRHNMGCEETEVEEHKNVTQDDNFGCDMDCAGG